MPNNFAYTKRFADHPGSSTRACASSSSGVSRADSRRWHQAAPLASPQPSPCKTATVKMPATTRRSLPRIPTPN